MLKKQYQQAFFVNLLLSDADRETRDWEDNLDDPTGLFSDSKPENSSKKPTSLHQHFLNSIYTKRAKIKLICILKGEKVLLRNR